MHTGLRIFAIPLAALLVSCGPSQEEKAAIATVTCNVIGESRNMDGALRINELNAAREELGEPPYLGDDEGIKQAYQLGLCEALVSAPEAYFAALSEYERKQREAEREKKIAEELKEKERFANTREALEEWKAALLEYYQADPVKLIDVTFDTDNEMYPLRGVYDCNDKLSEELYINIEVSFDNDLGVLSMGTSCRGRVLGSSGYRDRSLSPKDHSGRLLRENEWDALYEMAGERSKGSLLDDIKAVDVRIFNINFMLLDDKKNRRKLRKGGSLALFNPENFHPELTTRDLFDNPIEIRVFEKGL